MPGRAFGAECVPLLLHGDDTSKKDRPQVRRNVEAAIKKLNDLGVVVEEWPAR